MANGNRQLIVIEWLYNGYAVVILRLQGIWKTDVPCCEMVTGKGIYVKYYMSGKINHNEQHDALAELFRQQLEDHRLPVDDDGWSEIEQRLRGKRKTRVVWLWSAGAMAAAAAIALLVIINQPFSGDSNITVIPQIAVEQETMLDHSHEKVKNDHDHGDGHKSHIISQNTGTGEPKSPAVKANRTIPIADPVKAIGLTRPTAIDSSGTTYKENTVSQIDQTNQPIVVKEDVQPEEDKPVIAQVESDKPKLDVSLVEDRPEEEEPAAKGKNKWLLAAAFGTGGYTDGLSTGNDYSPIMADVQSFSGNNNYAAGLSGNIKSFTNMTEDDFSNISHLPPLSVGVTVRKNLGKFGGVESGLVYTYLSSQFEWSGYDVHQKLHYLGIPVNMVVYLWNSNPNWRIYFSGGIMVEKGLRAMYTQEKIQAGEIRTTTVNSSIDGLQWSLNGALGINYRFNKGIGIYFEPRVGYCFDNNQPISMRTEWPVFLGVNLGLNYEF